MKQLPLLLLVLTSGSLAIICHSGKRIGGNFAVFKKICAPEISQCYLTTVTSRNVTLEQTFGCAVAASRDCSGKSYGRPGRETYVSSICCSRSGCNRPDLRTGNW